MTSDDEEEAEDTTKTFIPNAPDTGPAAAPAAGAARGDSLVRRDSTSSIPIAQPAVLETIGVQSGAPTPPPKPVPKPKHGVLGLHPAALIAGMVALHILAVSLVTK